MIARGMKLIEIIIHSERIHPNQAGHGKSMPHQMNIIEILDVRISDNEDVVVKNKTELKGLGVEQKPDQDENRPT